MPGILKAAGSDEAVAGAAGIWSSVNGVVSAPADGMLPKSGICGGIGRGEAEFARSGTGGGGGTIGLMGSTTF